MAFVCHKELWNTKLSWCTGIRQWGTEDKERKEGIIMLDCLWKTNLVFRENAASKTFSTGTVLGITSKKPKCKAYTENTSKITFFCSLLTWQKSNTTSLLRLHDAVCSQLSGKDWKKKKSSKPVHHETTQWPSATPAVHASLCSGWRGWSELSFHYIQSIIRSLL